AESEFITIWANAPASASLACVAGPVAPAAVSAAMTDPTNMLVSANGDGGGGSGASAGSNGSAAGNGAAPQVPEQFLDRNTGQVKLPDLLKSYGELSDYKTRFDARGEVPATPDGYEFGEIELPDTVKLPDGMKLQVNENDPRIEPLRAF